jgi:hypothetical protein
MYEPIVKTFHRFFADKELSKELRSLLCRNADNIWRTGGLSGPALRQADAQGVALTPIFVQEYVLPPK